MGAHFPNMAHHRTFPDSFIGKLDIFSPTTGREMESYRQTDKQTPRQDLPTWEGDKIRQDCVQ